MLSDLSVTAPAPRFDPQAGPRGAGAAPAAEPVRADAVRRTEHGRAAAGSGPSPDDRALVRAAEEAARALFHDREVQVSSWFDDDAGRMVFRVADRRSGELLTQSPSEELLRLYASLRGDRDRPIVALEA